MSKLTLLMPLLRLDYCQIIVLIDRGLHMFGICLGG